MLRFLFSSVAIVSLLAVHASDACAHFPWLVVNASADASKDASPTLHCYFSEEPSADDPELLSYVAGASVMRLPMRGDAVTVEMERGDESLVAKIAAEEAESLFALQHDLGVMNRGDATFHLKYYALAGPQLSSFAWRKATSEAVGSFHVVPKLKGKQVQLTVTFEGEPVEGAEITFNESGKPQKTDAEGKVSFELSAKPLKCLRAKFVQPKGGELDGKKFAETRHYATLTFPGATYEPVAFTTPYPELPELVTSFGAAVSNDQLFVYGGHTGDAHEYWEEGQANTLRMLDLKSGKVWQELGNGPRIQGLALVAHKNKLYRLGGFSARNEEGEEHDLWSRDDAACFDIETGKWTDLPPLPEPRSSFDAAVMGDTIYVVGGWQLRSEEDSKWHKTAWKLDLTNPAAGWKSIPQPNFQRRALSVAAYDGKLYAIGGMQSSGRPTTETAVFDPKTSKWSAGPRLIGSSMNGFGSSSFAQNGKLFVTTYDGTLQRLNPTGSAWENVGNLPTARFFHRMLPYQERLLIVGGASMTSGKFEAVESIAPPVE